MSGSLRAVLPLCIAGTVCAGQAGERLAMRHVALDLPGPPSKVVPADLDGDGRQDLVVVVAYTEIEEIGEDRFDGLVAIATVIPALFDRRELRAYLATEDGGYRAAGPPLPLPLSVLHLEPGPPGTGLVAMTDEGLSRLRYEAAGDGPRLRFEPLFAETPVLAGTRTFQPSLEIVHELNGDGIADVLFPGADGLSVHLGSGRSLAVEPSDTIRWQRRRFLQAGTITHRYPQPEVRRVDSDGFPDLVFRSALDGSFHKAPRHVMLGSAAGRFRPLRAAALDCLDLRTDLRSAAAAPLPWPQELTAFRDLDGDGRAEAVLDTERSRGDGWRKELKDAKRPLHRYAFYRLDESLAVAAEPYHETEIEGHSFEADLDELPVSVEQFADLDADGLEDLVTVTLDFSVFQVFKILATKKIGVGLDFHVYAQHADGSFHEVQDLDLSEKLKIDLDDLKIGRFAQFAGDFDGDGRRDFVHLGRGKKVTVHAGRPGCRYSKDPDLTIVLDEEPASLDLVRIEDLDGDGRSDLRITRPLPATVVDATAPVRLDLYLTSGVEP